MTTTFWERSRDGRTYYVSIEAAQVVVGEHSGTGQSDVAGTCSHAEFAAGRWHDHIKANMGADVLSEVLAALAAR